MEQSLYLNLLHEANIPIGGCFPLISRDCSKVLPVIIDGVKVYFKYFKIGILRQLLLEAKMLKYLDCCGFISPKLYQSNGVSVFCEQGYCFIGTEAIKGMGLHSMNSSFLLGDVVAKTAEMHKHLMAFDIPSVSFSDYDNLLKFRIEQSDFCQQYKLVKIIETVLSKPHAIKHSYYIHGDLNFSNILIYNQRVNGFIDFSDAKIGYLEDDLGKLLQNALYFGGISIKDIRPIINLYEKTSGYKVDYVSLYLSIVYRMIYFYYFVKDRGETITKRAISILQKIQQELRW